MDFYEGTLEGKKVVVVRSGIGKVNAGMCTQIPVSYTHLDVYKRQENNVNNRVMRTRRWLAREYKKITR